MRKQRLKLCATLAVLLLCQAAAAQKTDYPNLKTQAEESGKAFIAGDYAKLADLTYAPLVELLGGKAKMVTFVEDSMKEMKADGFEPLSMTAGTPNEVVPIGRELYAVVPMTLKMKFKGGMSTQESFMIGISTDGGEKWTFVGGSGITPEQMKILLPRAAGKLRLPEAKPPVFTQEP